MAGQVMTAGNWYIDEPGKFCGGNRCLNVTKCCVICWQKRNCVRVVLGHYSTQPKLTPDPLLLGLSNRGE
jgi:hypothetical protein